MMFEKGKRTEYTDYQAMQIGIVIPGTHHTLQSRPINTNDLSMVSVSTTYDKISSG